MLQRGRRVRPEDVDLPDMDSGFAYDTPEGQAMAAGQFSMAQPPEEDEKTRKRKQMLAAQIKFTKKIGEKGSSPKPKDEKKSTPKRDVFERRDEKKDEKKVVKSPPPPPPKKDFKFNEYAGRIDGLKRKGWVDGANVKREQKVSSAKVS